MGFLRAASCGLALGLVALTTAACSGGAKQAPAQLGGGAPSSVSVSGSAAGDKAPSSSGAPDGGGSSSAAPQAGEFVSGAATPELALSNWTAEIIKGDYVAACGYMGKAPKGSAPGVGGTQSQCAQVATNATMLGILTGFHKSFTPAGAATAPAVTVAALKTSGATSAANDTQIKVGGKSLHDVIASNSKGTAPGSATTGFRLSQINKLWYVTDFNINAKS